MAFTTFNNLGLQLARVWLQPTRASSWDGLKRNYLQNGPEFFDTGGAGSLTMCNFFGGDLSQNLLCLNCVTERLNSGYSYL